MPATVEVVTTNVKICGITRLEDAELAVVLGAWAVGMVFYEPSPRRCSLEEAQRITATLRRQVELCGVFVNATLEEVERTSEELGLTLVQLHGDEGPAFCEEVGRRTGAKIIKAVQVAGEWDIRDVERFHTDYHLLDAHAQGPSPRRPGADEAHGPSGEEGRASGEKAPRLRGGTGETFEWGLVAQRRSTVPLILSGGLGPRNVAEAIATVRPFAVDSASGTEAAPGRKDPEKLRAFFAQVRPHSEGSPVSEGSSASVVSPA
jgi:phosphoribosylanthranilate isomerase